MLEYIGFFSFKTHLLESFSMTITHMYPAHFHFSLETEREHEQQFEPNYHEIFNARRKKKQKKKSMLPLLC